MPKAKTVPQTKAISKRLNKGVGPASAARIQQVAKWLSQGKSRATIIDNLMTQYDINADTAADYYNDGVRFLLPDDEAAYKEQLIKANATRLETIYEKAMERNDYKNAREAIAELNKMAGITGNGVKIGINNDKQNDSQQIIIKFDG